MSPDADLMADAASFASRRRPPDALASRHRLRLRMYSTKSERLLVMVAAL